MLWSLFRNPERELILTYLEEWDGLKGRSKEPDEQGDLFSPQDHLVDNIIKELFERFPEWDIGQQPENPLVFQPMDRDKLHTVCIIPSFDAHSSLLTAGETIPVQHVCTRTASRGIEKHENRETYLSAFALQAALCRSYSGHPKQT
jgi:hypothetical protein